MTELLPTQADRDAAWPFYETTIDWPATHEFKANWMAGGMDHSRIIQAFARHAAEARLSTEAAIVAWQPIETAPREETRILLCRPGIKPFIGFWSNWNRWWTDGSVDASRDHVACSIPTHWMPLSAPPADAIEQEKHRG